jgi:hypothetical protein
MGDDDDKYRLKSFKNGFVLDYFFLTTENGLDLINALKQNLQDIILLESYAGYGRLGTSWRKWNCWNLYKSNTLASILPVHLLLLEDKNKSKNILQF